MTYDSTKPYNELPKLPPKASIESAAVLRKTISASRALSELKGAITNLPNPTLFIDTINLQEAQASSEIENIITSQDELFRAASMDKKIDNPAAKEVLHYKDAMWHGVSKIKSKPVLSTNLFIELVQIIKENKAGIRNLPGTQLTNPATKKIIYTPPEGENKIRELLHNLEEFIHSENGLDPLVKMAVIHYQFEAIHPFFDGNGRTGRIILVLYLIHSGLLDLPCLYLSKYIIANKSKYYKNMRRVTENNEWEPWLLYMLDMIETTAKNGRERIRQIEKLMVEAGKEIQKELPKVYSKDLLEILFRLPYTKRQFLHNAGLGTLKTVGNYLKDLENAGFLVSEQIGKEKLYLNTCLMELLKQ